MSASDDCSMKILFKISYLKKVKYNLLGVLSGILPSSVVQTRRWRLASGKLVPSVNSSKSLIVPRLLNRDCKSNVTAVANRQHLRSVQKSVQHAQDIFSIPTDQMSTDGH
jgi:hypothetical protein